MFFFSMIIKFTKFILKKKNLNKIKYDELFCYG